MTFTETDPTTLAFTGAKELAAVTPAPPLGILTPAHALGMLVAGQDNSSARSVGFFGRQPVQTAALPTSVTALQDRALASKAVMMGTRPHVTVKRPQYALPVWTFDRFFADWDGRLAPDALRDAFSRVDCHPGT
jgi:hypothetical protein